MPRWTAAAPADCFSGVADHELAGLVCAWDRVEAHAAARKLAAIAEVFRRNPEDGFEAEPGRMPAVVHEFTRDQVAYALGESRAAADWLLTVAWHLATRLGGTLAALRDGVITRAKAELIVRLTHYLDDDEAHAVEAAILDRAGRLTPGGLRSALARAVLEAAPETAKERRQTAARFARVERWAEDSGNAALMGRELPPDEVLACDQRICWWAGELERRAWRAAWMSCAPAPTWTCSWGRTPGPARTARQPRPPATAPAAAGTAAGRRRRWRRGAAASRCGPGGRARGGGAGGFAGRVTLTVPLGTAAGLTDRPGELGGHGPVDPWLARDLVNAAAENPKTTWCVTVTDQHGHAVGHGCARPEPKSRRKRAGPGPPRGRGRVPLHPGQPGRAARRIRHLAAADTGRRPGPDRRDRLGDHRPVPAPVRGPGPRSRGQAPAPVPDPACVLHQPGVPAARRPVRLRAQCAV